MSGKSLNKMVKEMEEIEGIIDECLTNEELAQQKTKSMEFHNHQKPQQSILINRAERRRRERKRKRRR